MWSSLPQVWLSAGSFPLAFSTVSNHKQLPPVIMTQCQGIKAGRQQLYSWEKRCGGGRGRTGGCFSMLRFRLNDWKVPSIPEILWCSSVRYRGCIWLRKVLEERLPQTTGRLESGGAAWPCMIYHLVSLALPVWGLLALHQMEGGGARDLN